MSILSKLTLKSLLLNRRRSISTMVGIILSTALICATCTLGTSFRASMIHEAIARGGYFHVSISGLTGEELAELKNNRDFTVAMTITESGTAVLDGCQNKDKPYTRIYAMDQETFENLHFVLTEGRFPQNADEIVISKHMLTNGQLPLKLGDTLVLEVGERRRTDGRLLNWKNSYHEGEEQITDGRSHSYTIVGIINRPEYNFENFSDPCYTSIVCASQADGGRSTAFLTLNNRYDYKNSYLELFGVSYRDLLNGMWTDLENWSDLGDQLRYEVYMINRDLMNWELFAFNDSTLTTFLAVIGVVIAIILFSSVFCIRNSFAISATEKIHMYGMLASIGATKRQIHRSVILEGMYLGVIAIPLGIGSGILADYILIRVVNTLLAENLFASGNGLVLSVSVTMLLLSVVLGFGTIYCSAAASARRASHVSPIAQLRNAQEIKLNERGLKIPGWVPAIFHTGGVLAYKNLKRSRKKYRTTVASIAVSIFIFITMNVFIENAFQLSGSYLRTDYDYNVIVHSYAHEQDEKLLSDIRQMELVEEMYYNYQMEFCITDFTHFIDWQEGTWYFTPVYACNDAAFRAYAKRIGVEYESVRDKAILRNDYFYYVNEKPVKKYVYDYKAGDVIEGEFYSQNEETKHVPVSFPIGAVVEIGPPGHEGTGSSNGLLVINKDYANSSLPLELERVMIQSNDADALEAQLRQLNADLSITNIEKEMRYERTLKLVVGIFLYGFITVITLIGVTNVFNTITSNMELRQKEFAMLKSVGMTKKEFDRMILLETLFYSVKALCYGVLMGALGTVALYKAFRIENAAYLPIVPAILSGVFVFAFVFFIMRYSMAKLGRQNIIETIRNDNI